MGKIFAYLIMFLFTANTCLAMGLELSDVIREAREIEKMKIISQNNEQASLQPVKNETKNSQPKTKSACEQIKPTPIE